MKDPFSNYPTPQKVVEVQRDAVISEFDLRDELKNADPEDLVNEKFVKAMVTQIDEAVKTHTTPYNLGNCELPGNLVKVRLTAEAIEEYGSRFDAGDVKANVFTFIGDYASAPHHVMVFGNTSGRAYFMWHSDLFEIIPTQEM